MVGTANTLNKPFHVFRSSDLNHQIDIAPIDSKVQTPGANDRPQGSGCHRGLNLLTLLAIQTAVVNRDRQRVFIGQP